MHEVTQQEEEREREREREERSDLAAVVSRNDEKNDMVDSK